MPKKKQNALAGVKVGDFLTIERHTKVIAVVRVTRVLKASLETGGKTKWRLKDGYRVGDSGRYIRPRVRPTVDEDRRIIRLEKAWATIDRSARSPQKFRDLIPDEDVLRFADAIHTTEEQMKDA